MRSALPVLLVASLLFLHSCNRASDPDDTDLTPPGPVTAFVAADPGTGGALALAWQNPSDADLAGVLIVRREGQAPADRSDGQAVCDADPVSAAPPCDGASAHLDQGLSDGTAYHYAAFAYDGASNYAPAAQAAGTPSNTVPPLILSTFEVQDAVEDGALDLSWTQQPGQHPDYDGLRILRFRAQAPVLAAIDPANPPAEAVVALDDHNPARVQFTDQLLEEGVEYFYAAFTRDTAGNFGPGTVNSGTPVRPGLVLPPSGLVIDNPGTGNLLALGWTNSTSAAATLVRIIRFVDTCQLNPAPVTFDFMVDLDVPSAGGAQAWTDTNGVLDGQVYCYALFAKAGGDYSEALVGSAASSDVTPPDPVLNFQVLSTGAGNTLEATWQQPPGDFDGCVVQRAEGGYPSGPSDGVRVYGPGSETGFVDGGLQDGTTYFYAAWSYDDVGNWSTSAAQASAVPTDTTAPGQVTGFAVLAQDDGTVALTWSPPEPRGDYAGVWIARRTDTYAQAPDEVGADLIYVGADTSCVDSDTQAASRYYYAAFAFDDVPLYTAPAVGSDITRCGRVSNLSLALEEDAGAPTGNVIVRWDDPIDSEFYAARILRRTDMSPVAPDDPAATIICDDPGLSACLDGAPALNQRNYYAAYAHNQADRFALPQTADILATDDTTAPGSVTGFSATPDPTPGRRAIDLSWQNPPDADLVGVIVLRRAGADPQSPADGAAQLVCDGLATACADEAGVEDNLTYHYRAWAYDEVPNYGAPATATADRPYQDDDGDGSHEGDGDCDDLDPLAFPGAPAASCSATDYDCDGAGWEDAYCLANPPPDLDPGCVTAAAECQPGLGCDFHLVADMQLCSAISAPADYAYDVCVGGACVCPGTCDDLGCNPAGAYFPVPPAVGHSAWIRTPGAEPLVADQVSGLMWQGCEAGRSEDDCSLDGSPNVLSYADALAYCDGLSWGGHADWHLPDAAELLSLVDYGQGAPAIDAVLFPNTSSYYFRTSVRYGGDPTRALFVNLQNGTISHQALFEGFYVRCVRRAAVPAPPRPRFVRDLSQAGQPVVHDALNGLVWQGCQHGRSGDACDQGSSIGETWSAAVTFCDGLDWAGQTDWRMPNAKELHSLLDNRSAPNQIDAQIFPGVSGGVHWTSTEVPGASGEGLALYLNDGTLQNIFKTQAERVRCVRGP